MFLIQCCFLVLLLSLITNYCARRLIALWCVVAVRVVDSCIFANHAFHRDLDHLVPAGLRHHGRSVVCDLPRLFIRLLRRAHVYHLWTACPQASGARKDWDRHWGKFRYPIQLHSYFRVRSLSFE